MFFVVISTTLKGRHFLIKPILQKKLRPTEDNYPNNMQLVNEGTEIRLYLSQDGK